MREPDELISKLRRQPCILADDAWDSIFARSVVPRLKDALMDSLSSHSSRDDGQVTATTDSQKIWHAPKSAAQDLAGLLQHLDAADSSNFLDALVNQGAGVEPLFREVFEPAARCLGGLWEDDCCDDFGVAAALARLQLEARRLSLTLGDDCPAEFPGSARHPGHVVLVVSQPGEMHGLSCTLGSELFLRDGWDVICEIPRSDNALREILHENWIDVLDLSVSTALRRDQQLAAIRFTIRAARAASRNPKLAVIVDGRSFFERPQAYRDVGADIGCCTSCDLVPAALNWLRAHQLEPGVDTIDRLSAQA